jgi:ABC-type nitrate/sulfonate/bicarbonate transport system permease component
VTAAFARTSGLRVAAAIYPLALLLLVWWQCSEHGWLGNAFVLPSPARVWDSATASFADGTLPAQTLITLSRVLIAFAIALVAGGVIGILVGRIAVVRAALRPLIAFLFPTPKVAIYPAMLIILGLGGPSKIGFGVAEAVFPILLATAAAASQVETRLLWSARALGTPEPRLLWRVVFPAALGGMMTGARIALVGALIGVFLGEMIAGADGLGHLMAVSYRTLHTADMYVAVVTVSLVGLVLDRTFLFTRERLLGWSAEGDSG